MNKWGIIAIAVAAILALGTVMTLMKSFIR